MVRSALPARARLLAVASTAVLAGACGVSGPSTAATGTAVAVTASEYRFEPSSITVPAGEVMFSVTNAGDVEHEFEVFEGDRTLDEVEGLVPGLTKTLTIDLPPGDYTYVCKLAGHEELGMKGTLTVTPG